MKRISPIELKSLYDQNPDLELIDVRTPIEFREIHVEFARNMPLDSLQPKQVMANRDPSQPLYVICRTGNRGEMATRRFMEQGFENVINVDTGTQGCEAAGLPVIHGKKAVSLERQVRIAAGFLVLIGTILGATVSPYFYILAGAVGAGLAFAGITDTCAMGMLLARMPWNRVAGDTATPACSDSSKTGTCSS